MTAAVIAATTSTLKAPSIDYAAVSPMLIVFGAALVGVLLEAFAPRQRRLGLQIALSAVGLVAALVAVIAVRGKHVTTAGGAVVIDGPALFVQGIVLLLAFLALLVIAGGSLSPSADPFAAQASATPGTPDEARTRRLGLSQSEVYPLLLFSVGGMLLFPASDDLLTMFVALEVLSLPLYLLCGLARRRRLLSQEASMKYFLLGAFSSAFFLFGAAMLYGFSGSVRLSDISRAIQVSSGASAPPVVGADGLLLLGVALLAVGLLFKVGAAPFHAWTPDVYQGAPTPITGFMAACTKVAAFGALLRIAYVAVAGDRWDWQPVMWLVAVLTMVLGSVVAVVQADVKRMLAYSSIAHAGFILTGVLAMNKAGVSGVLFYLLAYGFTTIGAFALVGVVRNSTGEATHLSAWAGLGRRSPWTAAVFTLFLLAFAGIPLTSGFTSKYAVFSAAVAHAAWGPALVVVGVLSSAVAAFFYVRVIVLMYFSDPTGDVATVTGVHVLTKIAIGIGVVATLVLGVIPSQFLLIATQASVFTP